MKMRAHVHVLFLTLVSVSLTVGGINSQDPAVTTVLGTVHGKQFNGSYRGRNFTVNRYLGIPYGKPPVGQLRFQKPVAFGSFPNGTLKATEFKNSCPQYDPSAFAPEMVVTTEDCLFLNIFVPNTVADKPTGHAVMVFIHGGGLATGTSRIYLVDTLAAQGNVIVVTLNYRLWLFGFLNLGITGAKGNMGLWDQHLAIRWVHDNIKSFGGDPDRITVFGQSAGSFSAAFQSLYPGNQNLFNGVITESGTPFMPNGIAENKQTATMLASRMKCNTSSAAAILDCLKNRTAGEIVNTLAHALTENPVEGGLLYYIAASVDGEFIKQMPRKLLETTHSDEVQFLRSLNVMNGFNSGEGVLYTAVTVESMADNFNISRDAMKTQYIPTQYKTNYAAPGTTNVSKEIVELIAHEYTNWDGPNDPVLLRDQYVNMVTDVTYGLSAVEYTRLRADGSGDSHNYLYYFDPVLKGHVMPSPNWLQGAAHGDELAFLFGFPSYFGLKGLDGAVISPTDEYFDMSEKIIARWSNFAKTGDPNVQGETKWPMYRTGDEEYLTIGWNDSASRYLRAREVDFWHKVLPGILQTKSESEGCQDSYVSSAAVGHVSTNLAVLSALAYALNRFFCDVSVARVL